MTAVCLIGTAHNFALFARGKDGVIVDTTLGDMEVLERNPVQELLAKFNWTPAYPGAVALTAHQLAAKALGSAVEVITERPTRERPYSVPKAVQATARRALATSEKVDQLSVSTARQLASGAPVTLAKLRQVARVLSDNSADAATRQQFWGGQAGRKWALGALKRAGLTAAADTPDDAAVEDGESIVVPDDATQEDIDALMSDGAEPEEFEDVISSIAEDSHQFAPSPDNPDACVYCGSPPDYVIHDLPNRFAQVADQPHWFEFDPGSSNCAVCGKPVDAPIHDLTIKPPTAGETPQVGPVTASYLPSEVVDVSPVLLAAVLSAEQSDDQVKYFAGMIPQRDEMADVVYLQDSAGWSRWHPELSTWAPIAEPTGPVRLLDDASAYTLADQLSVFPEISVHALDLDERALFEAARAELEDEMDEIDRHTYLAVPPDDNEVGYSVTHDPADPNTATQLYATVNELSYVWNYVDHTWDGVEPGIIDQSLASPVSFDDAVLIAYLQSKDGISPIQPDVTLTDADTAGRELESTGFFNLFAGTLLNVPDDFDAVDLDVIEDDPSDAEFDDGSIDVNDLEELLFCFEIDPENPAQVSALHVQTPDDTWLAWNPMAVAWSTSAQPENCALIDARKAAEYAAWAYDQEHGGTVSTPAKEGELLVAIQSTEFANGFGKIFTLVPPQSQPQIYFDDQNASVRADGAPTPDAVDSDGYTAEERSKNAQRQVRDKFGRFAVAQARVALPDNKGKGTIRKIDPDRLTVEVAGDDGKIYDIPADQVQVLDEPVPAKPEKIDVSQIEAQPRATERTPKAFLPYTLPPMNAEALKSVVNGYQKFIETERATEDQKRKAREKLGRAAKEPIR